MWAVVTPSGSPPLTRATSEPSEAPVTTLDAGAPMGPPFRSPPRPSHHTSAGPFLKVPAACVGGMCLAMPLVDCSLLAMSKLL